MNNTTVNYSPTLSSLSSTASPAALKQIAAQNAASTKSSVEATSASPVAKADQTSLSLASSLITRTLSLNDVRFDKVAGLQKAIAAGTYNVSSADVADKLVKSLLG